MQFQNRLLEFVDLGWRHGLNAIFELLMQERGFGPRCFRKPHVGMDGDILKRIKPEIHARVAAIEEICR